MLRTLLAIAILSTTAVADDTTPESLDRASIAAAMKAVKSDVQTCGKANPAKGSVKVTVKVQPSGNIEKAEIKQTPDPALGECVLTAVKKAKFPATKKGGSFSYPFVF
jgi:TonB family protein